MEVKKWAFHWLVIIPTAAFVAVEILYGLPEARVQDAKPGTAEGYVVGRLVFGVFLAALLAWVCHRVAGGKRWLNTIVFSVVVLSSSGTTLLKYAQAQMRAASISTVRLPAFSIVASGPPHWKAMPTPNSRTILQWDGPLLGPGRIAGSMIVQLQPPLGDLDHCGAALEKAIDGKIVNAADTLDGERAIRVRSLPGSRPDPIEAMVSIREGRMYSIRVVAGPGSTGQDAMESTRQSWRWVAIESPVHHLEMRDEPATVLGNRVSVLIPKVMGISSKSDGAQLQLVVYNHKLGVMDLSASIVTGEFPEDDAIDGTARRVGMGLEEKYGLSEVFKWEKIDNSRPGLATQMIAGPSKFGQNWIMLALVDLDGKQFSLMTATVEAKEPADRLAYAAVLRQIAESTTLIPAPTTAPTSQ